MPADRPMRLHIDGEPVEATAWELQLTNDLAPWQRYPSFPITMEQLGLKVDAILKLDADTYDRLVTVDKLYTVGFDLNPWHCSAFGRRARLRRVRDILRFEWRRRVLRLTTGAVTIPNCEVTRAR